MKLNFSIPKSWKRKNKSASHSPTGSSSSSSRQGSVSDPCIRTRTGSISTASALAPVTTTGEKVSFLTQKAGTTRQDNLADRTLFHSKSHLDLQPRTQPEKRGRPSLDSLHVSVRLPSPPDRSCDSAQSSSSEVIHWSSSEPPRISRPPWPHTVSGPIHGAPQRKARSSIPVNFDESTAPSSRIPTIRPKRSMPELDGIWKGFLDDVMEDPGSLLMQDVNQDQTSRTSTQPVISMLEPKTTPRPPSPPSPNKYSSQSRIKLTKFSASMSELPYFPEDRRDVSTGSNKAKISPQELPTDLKVAKSKFPPALTSPPPLAPQPPVPVPNPVISAAQPSPAGNIPVVGPTPVLAPHPPLCIRKRPTPQPLDLRKFSTAPSQVPRSSTPESPLPRTPTTPTTSRSPVSQHPSHTRTTGSPVSILKKTPRGSGNHTHPILLSASPISPDYFGSVSPRSGQTLSPTESKNLFSRATPRVARSSYSLRASVMPPTGSHRATSSESVTTIVGGRRRTLSRPEIPVPRKPLQEDDVYVHPRPAPIPPQRVEWGYAV